MICKYNNCSELTSVDIPSSITSIGDQAFYNCSVLTSAIIPSGVTRIGAETFRGCSSLTSIAIPDSVIIIGRGAFSGCSSLTSVAIPDSVTDIGSEAFAWCSGLSSVTIGNSVTRIGYGAFYGCSGLTSVVIPSSVTGIESEAFCGCSSLVSVTLGNSVANIGDLAFGHCKLRSLKCKAITPPTSWENTFSPQTQYHTTLYIPDGTWDAYAYDDAWYKFINIREEITNVGQVRATEVYTLMNSRKMSYLVYDARNDRLAEVASVANVDESNLNHAWMMVEANGQKYVYNIGACKYLQATASGFTLIAEATAIAAKDGQEGIFLSNSTEEWSFVKNIYLQADDHLTPVIEITVDGKRADVPVYDLSGRRLGSKPQRGMYIQGGKKIVNK